MDEVRIGVAGIGGMGSNHTGYLTKGATATAAMTSRASSKSPPSLVPPVAALKRPTRGWCARL